MKHLFFSLSLLFALASTVNGQALPISTTGKVAKLDTIRIEILDPVEIEGHYFNVRDDEKCPLTLHVTIFTNWVQDCAGNLYAILPDNHVGCPVIHLVALDKKKN